MTTRPIIFSAPMVRALLAGTKQMTRRLAWGKGKPDGMAPAGITYRATSWQNIKPGDRLWVREGGKELSYAYHHDPILGEDEFAYCGFEYSDGTTIYFDGVEGHDRATPRPSIHMRRQYSRLTLVVTATRIERLQSISIEDAVAEGVCDTEFYDGAEHKVAAGAPWAVERLAFADLWGSLHGRDSWGANPEVVAVSFKVHRCNIDGMPEHLS